MAVGDDDGDASSGAITGDMVATWYENGTQVTNLNVVIEPCGGPYTLKVEVPNPVNVTTVYGLPNSTFYGTGPVVTYTLEPRSKICNLRPFSMRVAMGGSIKFPNGYNPVNWTPSTITAGMQIGGGFKTGVGFPTTGFEGAAFEVIGSGSSQSMYRCTTNSPTKIKLSSGGYPVVGANCRVTYTAKSRSAFTLGGTPVILLEYNSGTTTAPAWGMVGTYTIPAPTLWAYKAGDNIRYQDSGTFAASTLFTAIDACRGIPNGTTTRQQATGLNPADKSFRQLYLFTRQELTNSPHGLYTEGSSNPTFSLNSPSRDLGSFWGEWGQLATPGVYPDSIFNTNSDFWTAEIWDTTVNVTYVDRNGQLTHSGGSSSAMVAMCRG